MIGKIFVLTYIATILFTLRFGNMDQPNPKSHVKNAGVEISQVAHDVGNYPNSNDSHDTCTNCHFGHCNFPGVSMLVVVTFFYSRNYSLFYWGSPAEQISQGVYRPPIA